MLPELLAAAVASVGCAEHIETGRTPAAQRRAALAQSVTIRGVVFWSLRRAERQPAEVLLRGWKAAISVRHGAPLTVKVAARDRGWVALDYDRESPRPGPSVRFHPCAPDTPRFSDDGVVGNETAWAGGFKLRRTGCATLLLRRAGEEQWRSLRVPFGAPC